jgi:hypothetical protein
MSRKKTERVLRFRVYSNSGAPSTAQVLDFRGALNLELKKVGDYARTPTGLQVRWDGREPIQIFMRWDETAYGPAYLLLDNDGKGYAAGGVRDLNVELARSAWRWFEGAFQENLKEPEVAFRPSAALLRAREHARRALSHMGAARHDTTKAVAASKALAHTLTAWMALLKEHGRAFARRYRDQFILGAMLTEPYADAWQYSVPIMFTDYEKRLLLMKQQGMDTAGIVFLWRDDYTFSRPETFEPYDRVIDYARRIGLNVMGMVLDSFDYVTHRGLSDEEFVEVSRIQARNLAAHYMGRIRYWTVTDETNGKNFLPHSFQARLKAGNEAARAIKEIDPSTITLTTLLLDEDLLPLLARLKSQNAIAREVDVIALSLFHHLGPGIDIVCRKIHELFPEKRVGVGETGYTVGRHCDLVYSATLNYPYGLGGGFWWYHWDGMVDRGIDGQWYTTRFYRVVQDLTKSIHGGTARTEEGQSSSPTEPESILERDVAGPGAPRVRDDSRPRNEYEDAAWRGAHWLLGSGVLDCKTGAVGKAYDPQAGRFWPPEVSSAASALRVFVKAYGRSKDSAYLAAAQRAANFLSTRRCRGSDPSASSSFTNPGRHRRAESLACSHVIEALLDYYFATGEEKYLRISEEAADWLLEIMQNADGSYKSAYDLKTKVFLDGARNDWQNSRAFAHAKIASSLMKVWEAVKETEPRYRQGALRVLSWALTLQNYNGSFKGHYNSKRAQTSDDKFVPSLLEGVEGFFSTYVHLLRHPRDIALHPVHFAACRNLAGWLMQFAQSPEGGVWEWVYPDDSHTAAAGLPTAQAVRLWLRLYLVVRMSECLEAARRGGDFLLRVQQSSGGRGCEGGFGAEGTLSRRGRISTRATAIAVLALHELSDVLSDSTAVLNPALPRYGGFDPLF